MSLVRLTEQFQQAINHLLPQGLAFPRNRSSVLQKVIKGLAGFDAEFVAFADATLDEIIPHKTCDRLTDWEATLGLPEPCVLDSASMSMEQRRLMMLSKLASHRQHLLYEDSSPASLGFIKRLLEFVGFNVDIVLVGPDHLQITNINLATNCDLFRVGDRVGRRLRHCDDSGLDCFLDSIVPARFKMTIIEI
jgi:uncharacterized protein YmfQ (DUF2313 family)